MAELKTTRTAIVVGGASGIGWATAKALAADGCRVVIADRNAVGANDRAAELGTPHTAAYVDVTDEDSVQRLFDDAGPVDVVVSCAGFSNVGLITDMPVNQFRAVVDVCLTGAFIVAKHAGQRLGEGGVLVSISSLNGRQPAAGISAYCAAKAGLSMLTQMAALELGQPVSFTGKQAVVTGAGSGIGTALCRALAAAGADVLCTDVYGDAAERMAQGLGARSARLDVTAAAAVETTVDDVVARAGRLDLSPASGRCPQFNNAGIAWGGDTELLTLEQWNSGTRSSTSTSAGSCTESRSHVWDMRSGCSRGWRRGSCSAHRCASWRGNGRCRRALGPSLGELTSQPHTGALLPG